MTQDGAYVLLFISFHFSILSYLMPRTLLALLLLLLFIAAPIYAQAPKTFAEAKKMAWPLYAVQSTEFYCGCKYTGNRVDLASCGYVPRKNAQRAARIEWEHIVPAWVIGHQRQCWQKGGRKNCAARDSVYRVAEADLFNLVPSIGEVNGDRSNFSFSWLSQTPTQYGACQMVVDFKAKKAMPRPAIRGMIARTYFYMSDRYKLKISDQDRKLFEAWSLKYPVKPWEAQRNQLVSCRMGWGNPFVGTTDQSKCGTQSSKLRADPRDL